MTNDKTAVVGVFAAVGARGAREHHTFIALFILTSAPLLFSLRTWHRVKFMPAASATKSERKPESKCRSDWIHVNLFSCSFLHVVIYMALGAELTWTGSFLI